MPLLTVHARLGLCKYAQVYMCINTYIYIYIYIYIYMYMYIYICKFILMYMVILF